VHAFDDFTLAANAALRAFLFPLPIDARHRHDSDTKITKMKDGRTHLAHKAEQAVDLEGAIVGVTVQDADDGDTETSIETACRSRSLWSA